MMVGSGEYRREDQKKKNKEGNGLGKKRER